MGGQDGRDGRNALQLRDNFLAGLAQRLLLGALIRVNLDGEADIAALDHQTADHAGADDILSVVRVDYAGECRHHIGFSDIRHR